MKHKARIHELVLLSALKSCCVALLMDGQTPPACSLGSHAFILPGDKRRTQVGAQPMVAWEPGPLARESRGEL